MAVNPGVVGIDLGTTNSAVAHLDSAGRPTCLPNFEGQVLTPSAVLIEDEGAVVGREALKAAGFHPQRFAECFKRHMGEPFFPRPIDDRHWRPEVLSSLVLRRLRQDVQRQLAGVRAAVITVPASFDEGRRRATQQAGELAGWEVLDILNEPTAAALSYAHQQGRLEQRGPAQRERLLVFDLGGGTFDITVLEVRAGPEYRVLATEGEVQLGGHDWDQQLAVHLAEQFRAKTGHDPLAAAHGQVAFLHLARGVKESLSRKDRASVPAHCDGRKALLDVTQATFEERTANLLERARATTEMVLDEAKLTWKAIDRLLLVGGSTRMPMVQRMLREISGKELDLSLSADEAVAQGAAVYAHCKESRSRVRVVNVNSHSYRIVCRKKDGTKMALALVPRNSPLPWAGTKLIPVTRADQKEVLITVCEGESDDPEDCMPIGAVRLDDLPAEQGKRWVIGVTLRCHEDGTIGVAASVRDPDHVQQVVRQVNARLVPSRGMTEAELREAAQQLARLRTA